MSLSKKFLGGRNSSGFKELVLMSGKPFPNAMPERDSFEAHGKLSHASWQGLGEVGAGKLQVVVRLSLANDLLLERWGLNFLYPYTEGNTVVCIQSAGVWQIFEAL